MYVGDNTLSVLEIWGAEYQENNALLIRPESEAAFKEIAERENCPMRVLGCVTGDGRVVVHDSADGSTPVDLPLELVLGKMPQKTFTDSHGESKLEPLVLPEGTTVKDVCDRVLRLLSVGSKRFLVHKVSCLYKRHSFFFRMFWQEELKNLPWCSIRLGRSFGYWVNCPAAMRRSTSASSCQPWHHCSYSLWHHWNGSCMRRTTH